MFEMQGIRAMHCTIWVESVREIISAENSDIKFIVSDHPVTIYNHAAPPEAKLCAYPHDPTIALKASQTIFPLTRDFCLVLTNLEYARDPSTEPLVKRTFARNFRSSMTRTDALIRTRKLSAQEVARKIPQLIGKNFLKAVVFFLTVMPLVDCGLVNLIPDVCDFNCHLRDQMWRMAKFRASGVSYDPADDPRLEKLVREDAQRAFFRCRETSSDLRC
jgi:hypothetical protein